MKPAYSSRADGSLTYDSLISCCPLCWSWLGNRRIAIQMVVLCLVVVVWELAQPQSVALRRKFRHKITQQIRIPQTFPAKTQKPPKTCGKIDHWTLKNVITKKWSEAIVFVFPTKCYYRKCFLLGDTQSCIWLKTSHQELRRWNLL